MLHQFRAVHPCGVLRVIVMVEQDSLAVNPQRHLCRASCYNAVGMPHYPAVAGPHGREEHLRGIHLHPVHVPGTIVLVGHGMHYHYHSRRIHRYAHVRVASSAVGHPNGPARHTAAAPQHHIAGPQFLPLVKCVSVPLPASRGEYGRQYQDYMRKACFHS